MKYIAVFFIFVYSNISSQYHIDLPDLDLASVTVVNNQIDPFIESGNAGVNTPWEVSHGTPSMLNVVGPITKAITLYSYWGMEGCCNFPAGGGNCQMDYDLNELGSEGIYYPFNFVKDRQYILSGYFQALNSIDEFAFVLANDLPQAQGSSAYQDCSDNDPPITRDFLPIAIDDDWQSILSGYHYTSTDGDGNIIWQPFRICFTPEKDYSQLWFTLADDDVAANNPNLAAEAAQLRFGGLELECTIPQDIYIDKTEHHEEYWLFHRMLPPSIVAENVYIKPGDHFGVNILSEDEPVSIIASNQIIIEPQVSPGGQTWDFVIEPSLVQGEVKFQAQIVDSDNLCIDAEYNACDNYFNINTIPILTLADWLNGAHVFDVSPGGIEWIVNDSYKRCILLPGALAVNHPNPLYARWEPFTIGVPEPITLNAITYEYEVETVNFSLLYKDDFLSCSGHFNEDLAYYGQNITNNMSQVFITVKFENCYGSRTESIKVVTIVYEELGGGGGEGNSFNIQNQDLIASNSSKTPNTITNYELCNDCGFPGLSMPTSSGSIIVDKKNDFSRQQLKIIPNPTSGRAKIIYTLESTSSVLINLYDLNGQIIKNIQDLQNQTKGEHSVDITLTDLPSGMYNCKIQTASNVENLIIIKQ